MNPNLSSAIQVAGALHLLVAAANFFLPGMLRYRENLEKVSLIIRQIFFVHAAYIVLVLTGFALLCLCFSHELGGGSPLGRSMSGFLAVFWSTRVVIQVSYYDRAIKAEHPISNLLFVATFSYFAMVFATAAFL